MEAPDQRVGAPASSMQATIPHRRLVEVVGQVLHGGVLRT